MRVTKVANVQAAQEVAAAAAEREKAAAAAAAEREKAVAREHAAGEEKLKMVLDELTRVEGLKVRLLPMYVWVGGCISGSMPCRSQASSDRTGASAACARARPCARAVELCECVCVYVCESVYVCECVCV